MWDVEMVMLLRNIIDDLDCPYKYEDDRLQQLLLVASQLVKGENVFTSTYTVNIENYTLTPDPTATVTRDDAFINLTILKAACLLAGSGLGKSAQQGILVSEGPYKFDGRGHIEGKKFQVQTWCSAYADAKRQFSYTSSTCPGEAIIGPYRSLRRTGPSYYGQDYPYSSDDNRRA